MPDLLGSLRRTHTCGALRAANVGETVVLLGWVHRIRDLGSLCFLDLRDRYGLTQVVGRDGDVLAKIQGLKTEHVVAVIGHVERRSAETINTRPVSYTHLTLPTSDLV